MPWGSRAALSLSICSSGPCTDGVFYIYGLLVARASAFLLLTGTLGASQVKVILHPNSGVVVPGEMCAFVGPSGAGEDSRLLPCFYSSPHCVSCGTHKCGLSTPELKLFCNPLTTGRRALETTPSQSCAGLQGPPDPYSFCSSRFDPRTRSL